MTPLLSCSRGQYAGDRGTHHRSDPEAPAVHLVHRDEGGRAIGGRARDLARTERACPGGLPHAGSLPKRQQAHYRVFGRAPPEMTFKEQVALWVMVGSAALAALF